MTRMMKNYSLYASVCQMASLAHSPTNDNRFEVMMKSVRELGREAAEGKDSLPKLALSVMEAADQGVIDLELKHDAGEGKKEDDIAVIYREYIAAQSKKALHEHTPNGLRANASKLRQIAKATIEREGNDPDFVTTMDNAVEVRRALIAAKEKLTGAFNGYVAVARMQLEDTSKALTEDDIKTALRKAPPPEKNVVGVLEKIEKQLHNIITGDNRDGLKDQSEAIIQAHELIRAHVATLVQQLEVEEALDKLSQMGAIPELERRLAAEKAEINRTLLHLVGAPTSDEQSEIVE